MLTQKWYYAKTRLYAVTALDSSRVFLYKIGGNMGWKILEINSESHMRLFLNNIIIENINLGKISIPIDDIDTLLIDNYTSRLTIQTINKLAEKNVNVIICDNKHIPKSTLIPFVGNYNTVKIFEKQTQWTGNFKGRIWKQNIIKKIYTQHKLLSFLEKNEYLFEIENMMNSVELHDITNREGHVAKLYWHSLFGKSFNRRDDNNEINHLLNFGYAILLSYFTRSIVKKGLDPRIGIFHKSYNNYQALSSDLMESFRPFVDFFIIKIIRDENTKNLSLVKSKIIESFNQKILIKGKLQYVCNAIDDFIDEFIRNETIVDFEVPFDRF